MLPREMDQPRSRGHGPGDGADLRVGVRKHRQGFPQNFRVGRRRGRDRLASIGFETAQPVKLIRLLHRRGVPAPLFSNDVQQHRFVLRFEKLEGANQRSNVVTVNRAVVPKA